MALKNDCFALPAGVSWTPVDEALRLLRARMEPVTASENVPLRTALGRVLSEDIIARRSTPPADNSAVDGYALAYENLSPTGEQLLKLSNGRAAAGAPYRGHVAPGEAVRILTGAMMPSGTDSVVMDEDVDITDDMIRFGSGLKQGANRRLAGEDIAQGAIALRRGTKLSPADLAQTAAIGMAELTVHRPLRVAILSTGDELCEAGTEAGTDEIYDANRPMLAGLLERLGLDVIDLGIIPDTAQAVEGALSKAAARADAIITSGGASAGDEDHLSAVLNGSGAMHLWRIAVKPGRPMAMAQIDTVPVFGLPGNPVAAFVCFLIFIRPALLRMAGMPWDEPQGFDLKSDSAAKKKAGRTEYLRARVNEAGMVEKFPYDGSGLISGLRWSTGLMALEHERGAVARGDTVRFIPYSAFGIYVAQSL